MKKTIKDSLRHLPGIVATLYLFAAAACMPESFRPGIETPGSQDRSPMTLELGISSPESSVRTRADESGPMQDSTINSIWIGVFDIETGDIVGQTASNRAQGKTEEHPFRTAKVDILYYDAHPQVRIFGVANYIGVNARRTSDSSCNTPLDTLLSKVENITDFLDISVEAKEPGNSAPLMMGVYTNNKDASGLYAVDVNSPNLYIFKQESSTDIELNKLNPDNPEDGKYDRIKYADIRKNGQIRLRRLVSQINVTVVPGQNPNKTVELSNMSYRRVNLPKEVYLQERQTKEFESSWNAADWGKQTPNKADVLVDYDTGNSALGYESDTDFKAFNNSFTFYQYENKHWGTADNQSERERVWKETFAGNPVFTALCGEEENGKIYNNYASYFEINVDVAVTENGKTQNANVTYRIHEGFCNKIDGTQYDNRPKPGETGYDDYARQIAPDFTCVRNTIYNYTITINGLTSITVDAEGEQHTHKNPGVLGGAEFFTESTEEATKPIIIDPNDPENGDTYSFTNVEAAAYICYFANGGKPQYYAGGDKAGIDKLMESPILPAGFNAATKGEPNNFGFKFDDSGTIKSISDIFSPATRADSEMEKWSITGKIDPYFGDDVINVYPEDYKMSLYLLLDSKVLEDDCINNTYTYIHALPLDSRQEMDKFAFSLAFENDWDEAPAESNGAVVGHLKKIQVQAPKWETTAEYQDGLKYTVFLDDKLIADNITTCPFELEEEFTYTANSVHTIKVVAEDPNNTYKPCTISQNFIVYPTEFEWSYRTYNSSYFISDGEGATGYYYGSTYWNLKDYETSNKYYALYQVASNMDNQGKYLNTIGSRDVFKINVPYDAVLTVYATSTVTSAALDRTLTATQNGRLPQTSSVGLINNANGQTPFTFYVEKGSVTLSSTGNINIYAVKLTYHDPAASHKWSWDFSDSKSGWTEFVNAIKGGTLINKIQTFTETEINGLHIIANANDKNIVSGTTNSNDTYISFGGGGGGGDEAKLCFWFWAHNPGTLSIYAASSSTGSGSERDVMVRVGDAAATKAGQTAANTAKPNNPITIELDEKTITAPTKVFVYSRSSAIYIYRIDYEEN